MSGAEGGDAVVDVWLLDGVRLFADGNEIALRGDRERALLARLALDCGSSVPRGVLIEDVWGGAPGRSGAGGLRAQVKRLRDHLAPQGFAHVVETTPDGYRLSDSASTDVARVERAIEDASTDRSATKVLAERFAGMDQPLRGRPLHGLEDLPFVLAAVPRLAHLQLSALTWHARLCLDDGRADQADAIASRALERAPMDEGLAALRMDALTTLGRNREALAVAHRLRSELTDVGLVPSEAILEREQEVLNPIASVAGPVADGIAGRRPEIRRLHECLDLLADGAGTTVTISGPAGIGKTALAQMVADAALARDWAVITTVADEMERQSPFHLLQSTLLRTGDEPARRLDLGSVLADVPVPGDPGGFDPAGARLAVATRLDEMLADRTSPVVVVAEDLHWADDSSLAVLRSLSRSAQQLPLLLVLTGRPESDWQGALGEVPRSEIRLGPLSEEDACELAERHVNGSLGPDLGAAVVSAGGNPLLVIEYLRGMAMEDRLVRVGDVIDSSGIGAPTSIQSLAARRLRSLPPRLIEVLETAAVLGRASDGQMLDELCELGTATLAELLQPAEVAAIISFDGATVAYEHDLFRDAVYAGIADRRRAELHRRVAHAFAAADRPVISVAAHALLSGSDRDDQTVAWMREAAAAVVAVEPRSAITFLDRALALSHDVDERFHLQHAKVDALTTAGELQEATELVDVLVRARRPETAALQVRYGGLLMAQAKANEARHVLAGVHHGSLTLDQRGRWEALDALCSYAAFDQPAARALAEQAITTATAAADPVGLSMAHGVVGRCDVMSYRYRDGLAAGRLSAEYADGDPTGGAHLYLPWYFVGMTLLDLDEHEAVEDALARGRAVSTKHHLHFSSPMYLTLETALAQRIGDLDRAQRAGVRVLEIEHHLGPTLVSAWVRGLLSLTAIEAGDIELAETYCADAERAQAAGSPQGAHIVALARAELHRRAGDLHGAYAGLEESWRFFDGFALHACKPFIAPALVRSALKVDAPQTVDAVRSEMEALTGLSEGDAHRALRDWVVGLANRDLSMVEAARRGLDRAGRAFDTAVAADDEAALRTLR